MSIIDRIQPSHLRTLRLVAEAGASRASTALTKWVRKTMGLIVTRVEIVPFRDVPGIVGGEDKMLVGVFMRMVGEIEGNLLLAFTEADAANFLTTLMRKPVPPPDQWGELQSSAMQETANILGSAFLNALSDALDYDVKPTSPAYAHDFAASLIDAVLLEYAAVGDKAIVMDTAFSEGDFHECGLGTCHLFLLPTPASLEKTMTRLGLAR